MKRGWHSDITPESIAVQVFFLVVHIITGEAIASQGTNALLQNCAWCQDSVSKHVNSKRTHLPYYLFVF